LKWTLWPGEPAIFAGSSEWNGDRVRPFQPGRAARRGSVADLKTAPDLQFPDFTEFRATPLRSQSGVNKCVCLPENVVRIEPLQVEVDAAEVRVRNSRRIGVASGWRGIRLDDGGAAGPRSNGPMRLRGWTFRPLTAMEATCRVRRTDPGRRPIGERRVDRVFAHPVWNSRSSGGAFRG